MFEVGKTYRSLHGTGIYECVNHIGDFFILAVNDTPLVSHKSAFANYKEIIPPIEGWVNVWRGRNGPYFGGHVYSSKERARSGQAGADGRHIATIKITYDPSTASNRPQE